MAHDDDWYCGRVLSGELAITELSRSENVLAFVHPFPFWEHHVLVIPIRHFGSLAALRSPEDDALLLELMTTARRFAQQLEAAHGGCLVVTNIGELQSPTSKHLHIHVAAGRRLRGEQVVSEL
jgi:histidine triad (HIT) family protein